MNLQPIGPSPYPLFTAFCRTCARRTISTHLMADLDGEPGTYYCEFCVPQADAYRMNLAHEAAFRALSPAMQRDVRVKLYGAAEERAIRARAIQRANRGGV